MAATYATSTLGGLVHLGGMLASAAALKYLFTRLERAMVKKHEADTSFEHDKLIKLPASPPLVTMGSFAVGLFAREALRVQPAPVSSMLSCEPVVVYSAGMALFAGSLCLIYRAAAVMDSHGTPAPHRNGPAQTICKSDVFGIFRHPIYIGMMGSSLAAAFVFDSAYSLAGFAITTGYLFGHVMPVEEAWMALKFGKDYEDYKSQVKRFYFL
mmetsp:Transcript_9644/g.27589  ORF Transcript_9644/g.27589 Transcript_9644/m.27589 type:complete len:212 (+) Transcript_9644:165-800(+)